MLPIRGELDPPIAVRAQQGIPLHRLQRLGIRQTLPVSRGHAEQHDLGIQARDPLRWVEWGVA